MRKLLASGVPVPTSDAIFQFDDSHNRGGSHFHYSPGVMSVVRVQHFDACAHESLRPNDGFYASCCVFACCIKVDVIVLDAMFVVVQKAASATSIERRNN